MTTSAVIRSYTTPGDTTCLMALWRDRGPCPHVPDVLAEAMTGVAAVSNHPLGHPRQASQKRNGVGQLMHLARRDVECDGVPRSVCDHASLGPIPTPRTAQRFTLIPLR